MPAIPDLDALAPSTLVVVAIGLVLFQTAFVAGFLVPGGKAAILSGVMAGLGHVALPLVYAGIATAAVVGATVGYLLGRRYCESLFEIRVLRRHRIRPDRRYVDPGRLPPRGSPPPREKSERARETSERAREKSETTERVVSF